MHFWISLLCNLRGLYSKARRRFFGACTLTMQDKKNNEQNSALSDEPTKRKKSARSHFLLFFSPRVKQSACTKIARICFCRNPATLWKSRPSRSRWHNLPVVYSSHTKNAVQEGSRMLRTSLSSFAHLGSRRSVVHKKYSCMHTSTTTCGSPFFSSTIQSSSNIFHISREQSSSFLLIWRRFTQDVVGFIRPRRLSHVPQFQSSYAQRGHDGHSQHPQPDSRATPHIGVSRITHEIYHSAYREHFLLNRRPHTLEQGEGDAGFTRRRSNPVRIGIETILYVEYTAYCLLVFLLLPFPFVLFHSVSIPVLFSSRVHLSYG